jgi:hypothetical protein
MGDFGFVMSENIAKNTDLCQQARYLVAAHAHNTQAH